MSEAWINGILDGNIGAGVRMFKTEFVLALILCNIEDSTDAMGVLCMGGEL